MLRVEVVFTPLELLLQTIYLNYLTNSYCLTIITDYPINVKFQSSFVYINYNATENLADQMLQVSEMGCSDYIVHINTTEEFMKAFDYVNYMGNIRRSDKKIIFLPFEKTSNMSLLSIFAIKEARFVPNIVVVFPRESIEPCEVYDLITHKYVGSDEVVNQPLYLNQWNSCIAKLIKTENIFLHDMSNLQGKTVKIAAFNYKPYAVLDLNSDENSITRDGTEIRIVDEFCRWVNCTVELVRDDINEWGEIYENRTGNGVLGSVVEDRADMGISALYSWYEEFLDLDFSIPTIRSSVTCIAPSPRLLNSWEMPLLPFSWLVWIALTCAFILSVAALSFAKGSCDGVFLSTFGMITMQAQEDVETSWRIRSVTVWLLLTGLVIDNAYGAGLAATFTVPKYEPSIDTIRDLVDRKIEWGATSDAWIFSLILSSDPVIQQLLSQFRIYSQEILKNKTFDRSFAFAIETLPSGHYAIGEYITKDAVPNLMIMLEDFYYEQCVVMLRKSSPYTQKLNEFIGRLHQSGILLAWETQVALKHLDFKVQLEVKLSRIKKKDVIVALSFHHVVGIFILYLTGIILSILTFLVEVWFGRKRRISHATHAAIK